jgi:hypothetical protein
MKSFSSFTMVKQAPEALLCVVRDRLPEIARDMDDIESIELLERVEETDGSLTLVNSWHARHKIPALLQKRLGAATISWIDRAQWLSSQRCCRWTIEPSLLRGYIVCAGSTTFEPAMTGRGTRVTFDGTFDLKPGFLAGVSASLEPLISSFVESVVSTIIPRNLARAIAGANQILITEARVRAGSSN